jgi:hypothetical protein
MDPRDLGAEDRPYLSHPLPSRIVGLGGRFPAFAVRDSTMLISPTIFPPNRWADQGPISLAPWASTMALGTGLVFDHKRLAHGLTAPPRLDPRDPLA